MSKKKSKSILDSFLFLVNSLLATLLLLAYLLPYISPIKAPTLAVLSLFVPVLIISNLLFAIFWLVRLKRKFLLSTLSILLGFGHLSSLYQLSDKKIHLETDFSIMNYNVRMFNHFGWNPDDSTAVKAYNFIEEKYPDILVVQEFYQNEDISFEYPHQFIKTKSKNNKFGLAIFSIFPIIESGSLDIVDSANNIIYADLKIQQDTVRIYNVHLESLKLNPEKENFGEQDSDKLLRRMKSGFQKQGYQTEILIEHLENWSGKSIISGDLNNTAFSWVYKKIAENRQDAFKVAGKGTGRTFDYALPLRIDFILADQSFEINHYKTYAVEYSDHFPIFAKMNISKD